MRRRFRSPHGPRMVPALARPAIPPRRRRSRSSAARAVFAAAALAAVPASAAGCGIASATAQVEAVTERAELRLGDGRLVRLAGLDIPASAGFDARSAARALLAEHWAGSTVAVALLAAGPDRWGRWLADLALPERPSASTELLQAGLARVRPEFETRGCEGERLAAEAAARAAGSGLWNDPDSILDAGDLDALRGDDGRFVLIEGVVRRVGVGRSRVYLDFGRRGGFSVVVATREEPAFQRRGVVLRALAGQAIRVRGVLDDRFGPRIELADPLMIERLDVRP
jgi:endonuclease YncB( thermonuclease family)